MTANEIRREPCAPLVDIEDTGYHDAEMEHFFVHPCPDADTNRTPRAKIAVAVAV
jgi:hypothetical protein